MLEEITIKNFKSFNEEQTFSLEASPKSVIGEYFEAHTHHVGDKHILKISSFYGPNGGGKSNVLDAIIQLKKLLKGNRFVFRNADNNNTYLSSIFCESKITELTAFFIDNEFEYGYSIQFSYEFEDRDVVIEDRTITRKVLVPVIYYEEMARREIGSKDLITVYKRNQHSEIESNFLLNLDIAKNNSSLLSPNMSVLHYIYRNYIGTRLKLENNNVPVDKSIVNLIKEINSIGLMPDYVNRDMSFYYDDEELKEIIEKEKSTILKFLKAADFDIDDLSVKKIDEYNQEEIFLHIGDKELPLRNSSKGTKKMFGLVYSLIAQSQINIFLADDFDANFHPKITKAIIEYFSSSNNTQRQFIFNSHDILNMSNEIFRRDEIWFVYKNDNHSSILMPLSNIVDYNNKPIRKDAVYSKQYLEGKFGGDPFVRKALSWDE